MADVKEAYFGGLPEAQFTLLIAKLLASVGVGGAEGSAAGAVLVSLAKAEHKAAVSTQARMVDVIVKTVEINTVCDTIQNAGAGAPLIAAYALLVPKLDELTQLYT
jgi:hypothetical protein